MNGLIRQIIGYKHLNQLLIGVHNILELLIEFIYNLKLGKGLYPASESWNIKPMASYFFQYAVDQDAKII